jgi:hypothetical protein
MESIAQAIRDYGGVILEIAGTTMERGSSPIQNPPIKGNPLWYHFVCGTSAGYYSGQKVIAFANSWGQIGG